jgi:photosystem II stability/assembly factor-like uncharacterized protein
VQQSCPTSEDLYDASFINRNTGWACGSFGEIIKTTNGGTNWFMQSSGVEGKLLRGIFAIDSNFVYCVGHFETILKTTNGGNNWQILRDGPMSQGLSFMRLYFLNKDTGWLMKNYYILRTTNGCASFDSCYVNHSYIFDIQFKNINTGLICGQGSVVLKTTNSGFNWYDCPVPVGNELPHFWRISIVGSTCWCIGDAGYPLGSKVFKSTNYGDTWDSISRIPDTIYGSDIYCNSFKSLNTGYCGGGVTQLGNYPRMFKTTNGGYNWYVQSVPNPYAKVSLWFLNDSIGWSVGGGGEILYTTTGGQWLDIKRISENISKTFELYQNYPNPFNSETIIQFDINEKDFYKLEIYDILGEKIDEIMKEELKPGTYKVKYNAYNLSSGIYFYRLCSGKYSNSQKFILIK